MNEWMNEFFCFSTGNHELSDYARYEIKPFFLEAVWQGNGAAMWI
jgi:hypothetical protein